MTDNLTEEQRKKNMRLIRSKGTKLEERIAQELWKRGIRLRRNVSSLYGKPDFAVKKYKIVIFIDSCFWHGCPLHFIAPKSNQEYWKQKVQKNILRDLEITHYYKSQHWNLLRVWEHQINDDLTSTITLITEFITHAKEL